MLLSIWRGEALLLPQPISAEALGSPEGEELSQGALLADSGAVGAGLPLPRDAAELGLLRGEPWGDTVLQSEGAGSSVARGVCVASLVALGRGEPLAEAEPEALSHAAELGAAAALAVSLLTASCVVRPVADTSPLLLAGSDASPDAEGATLPLSAKNDGVVVAHVLCVVEEVLEGAPEAVAEAQLVHVALTDGDAVPVEVLLLLDDAAALLEPLVLGKSPKECTALKEAQAEADAVGSGEALAMGEPLSDGKAVLVAAVEAGAVRVCGTETTGEAVSDA